MKTIWLTLIVVSALAPAASGLFATAPAMACRFDGPGPTPPVPGAQLGPDCIWYLPDGTTKAAVEPQVINIRPSDGALDSAQAADSDDANLPVYIILPLAFIVPLAVIFIGSFLIPPKGGGGH